MSEAQHAPADLYLRQPSCAISLTKQNIPNRTRPIVIEILVDGLCIVHTSDMKEHTDYNAGYSER